MATATLSPTSAQIGIVLNDIAATAQSIQRLAVALCQEEDERDIEAMRQSIEALSQRIGFLADKTASEIPGTSGPAYASTAEEWMLPPAYHEEARNAE